MIKGVNFVKNGTAIRGQNQTGLFKSLNMLSMQGTIITTAISNI